VIPDALAGSFLALGGIIDPAYNKLKTMLFFKMSRAISDRRLLVGGLPSSATCV
jgi:hypothetical protein